MAASALVAKTPEGRRVGLSVAGAVSGVSMVTDYDLSVAKLVPIEVHELADYASAAMSIAAPFVLGYHRRDPLVAALHVFAGITTLIGSLMTDYRANRGVTWRGWPDRGDGRIEGARAER